MDVCKTPIKKFSSSDVLTEHTALRRGKEQWINVPCSKFLLPDFHKQERAREVVKTDRSEP